MADFFRTYWLQLGILAALAFGVWYIDHRGYQRAKHHYEQQERNAQARAVALARRIEQAMTTRLNELDRQTADRLREIDVQERTVVQPIIQREIRNDPRLSDPARGLSGELRDALNSARAASGDAAAPRERQGRVPARRADQGQ